MKTYQKIIPEIIVGLGEDTIFLEATPPFRTVVKLHILLEDWLGDDFMKCQPCYIVTQTLREKLETTPFTGFEFDDMVVEKDEYFNNNYQLEKDVPKFYWMKIVGLKHKDDLFLDDNLQLFIDNALLDYLKQNCTINYLDVNPERNEFDDLLDKMMAERGISDIKPVIFKIHEGKEYTEEDWKKYKEEEKKNRPPGSTWSLLDDDD